MGYKCLVQVGNCIELDTVGRQFEPYLWHRPETLFPNGGGNKAAANICLESIVEAVDR